MDREAWAAAAHGVAKSWTRLSNWTELKFSHHELPVFVCLEKSLSLLHFWRITLPGKVFLVSRFFFQCFEYIIPLSLACKVSAEKSADSLWRFLHKWYASFLLFSFFFPLSFISDSFVLMYLGHIFGLNLFGNITLWTWYPNFSPYIESYQQLFLQISFLSPFFSFHPGIPNSMDCLF